MKVKLIFGMKTKLITAFSVIAVATVVGGISVNQTLTKLREASHQQGLLVSALGALKDLEGSFANANLLGMDIIVDHYEAPNEKVSRTGELDSMDSSLKTEAVGWNKSLSAIGLEKDSTAILANLNALLHTLHSLIAAINAGEKRPEIYAKFDTDIDGAKETAAAIITAKREKISADFEHNQQGMESSFVQLSNAVIYSFLASLAALLFWATPVTLGITRSIEKLQRRLTLITDGVRNTSLELEQSSSSMAAASSQSAAAIQQSVSAMAEIGSMLSETTKNANDTVILSRDVLDQAQRGVGVMEEMSKSMEAISDSSTRLKEIVKIITNISTKTNIINDVVFKTQLLAVNASIEAARAGHHGKGFAVVANEVASLAALSGKASSEIRELLATSSEHVSGIVEGTSHAIKGGELASNRSNEAFNMISKSVAKIVEKVENINDASREQEAGVAQTTTALEQMNLATEVTNNLAQLNAKLGRRIATHAEDLNEVDYGMNKIVSGNGQAETLNANVSDSQTRQSVRDSEFNASHDSRKTPLQGLGNDSHKRKELLAEKIVNKKKVLEVTNNDKRKSA